MEVPLEIEKFEGRAGVPGNISSLALRCLSVMQEMLRRAGRSQNKELEKRTESCQHRIQ